MFLRIFILFFSLLGGLATTAWFAASCCEWEGARRPDSDALAAALLARMADRGQVGQDVLAGRLSLLEAATRFRDIDRAMPEGFWDRFGRTRPDDSDHESYCRQVIEYVRPTGEDEIGQERVARLEADLCEHLKNGTLRLPDAPTVPLRRKTAPTLSLNE